MSISKTRILFEWSGTWDSDANTGIQRVVRNIIKEAPGLAGDFNVEVVPVIVRFNRFFHVNKKPVIALFNARFRYFLKRVYYKIRPFFKGVLLTGKIEGRLVLYCGRFLSVVSNIILFPLMAVFYIHSKIVPGKGDVLLLLDSSWIYPVWSAVEKAKNNGAIVGLVIHDIIPLTHPHFFPSVIVKRFNIWFEQVVQHVDFFIANSEVTQIEVQKYLSEKYPHYLKHGRVGSFLLGCTIDNIAKDVPVGEELKKLFQRNNVYISVGTMEPRKNHQYILDAFDLVWRRSPQATLCIIGKIGWLSEHVINRIKTHPLFEKNLFMFNNVSDTGLDYCYKHSKALIFASHAEGFGLPIVEALGYGLPVLASDISIHREVGRDFCAYFDISSPVSLARIVIDIESAGQMPKVRSNKEYKPLAWQDSCRELFTQVQILSRP